MKKSFGKVVLTGFAVLTLSATSACGIIGMSTETKSDTAKGSLPLPAGITPAMANEAAQEAIKAVGLNIMTQVDQKDMTGEVSAALSRTNAAPPPGVLSTVDFNKMGNMLLTGLIGKSYNVSGAVYTFSDHVLITDSAQANMGDDPHEIAVKTVKKIGAKIKDLFQDPAALKASAASSNVNLN